MKHVLEAQLKDGREWLFDTVSPSLADISLYFVVEWLLSPAFKHLKADHPLTTQTFPSIMAWGSRIKMILQSKKPQNTSITGQDALKLLAEKVSLLEPSTDAGAVDTADGKRLGIAFGDAVSIAPEDTGTCFDMTYLDLLPN